MDDWRKEFQYLLDRKVLSRDELAYLFGQIKSIIDREIEQLQAENEAHQIKGEHLEIIAKQLQAELDWWHNLINKHHDNKTCPNLKTYVERLQAENKQLKKRLEQRNKENDVYEKYCEEYEQQIEKLEQALKKVKDLKGE